MPSDCRSLGPISPGSYSKCEIVFRDLEIFISGVDLMLVEGVRVPCIGGVCSDSDEARESEEVALWLPESGNCLRSETKSAYMANSGIG